MRRVIIEEYDGCPPAPLPEHAEQGRLGAFGAGMDRGMREVWPVAAGFALFLLLALGCFYCWIMG